MVLNFGEVIAASTEVEDVVHDSSSKTTARDGQRSHQRPLIRVWVVPLEEGEREGIQLSTNFFFNFYSFCYCKREGRERHLKRLEDTGSIVSSHCIEKAFDGDECSETARGAEGGDDGPGVLLRVEPLDCVQQSLPIMTT